MNYDLILEALRDYRSWFNENDETDTEKRKQIDDCISQVETLRYTITPFLSGERVTQLGLKAYSKMTGEDLQGALSKEEAEEYEKLAYGEEVKA